MFSEVLPCPEAARDGVEEIVYIPEVGRDDIGSAELWAVKDFTLSSSKRPLYG